MRTRTSRLLLHPAFLLCLAPAAAGAVTLQFDTPISGDVVPVTVSIEDRAAGDGVAIGISIPPGSGDLLGLFGSVTDEGLVSSMSVEDPTGIVTQWSFSCDGVWKVGGGNTMAPVKKWDWGIRIGDNGSAGGAVESANFAVTGPGLHVDHILGAVNQGWVLGVRIQSTNGSEGSSKLGLSGEAPRLRISAPEDGALLGASPVAVLGTVLGSSVAVDVNGAPASVSGGS